MKIKTSIIPLMLICIFISACNSDSFNEPTIDLSSYKIAEGFELQAVASEPFIEAPVSMDFDNKGRMWVVEMKGYMQNIEGTGQEMPNGTISILEDLDGDGITDHSKIFMKNLILPRALAHVYGGLLYAEPPNLWFVEIENDKPKNKILVDSLYADGGNVEHQPNGLMMNIDNWIYNAKSNFRYQRKNGHWIKEVTTYRGQWGISKDDFGRLYYNNNSTQLIGDYVLPNTSINNPYFNPTIAVNNTLTNNQRVYPLHATSVNRGYVKGVLDKDSLLINITSACGPLIYRGNQFPKAYYQNAFVCAPEANIVKRNILNFETDKISAKQAWDTEEFLASTDEGFRPVNLFNGPDGNMYVVDMHRGIIQDKAYLTPYLSKQLSIKKLDTIIGMGRILKIQPLSSKSSKLPAFEKLSTKELVDLLKSSNGWIRDRAQQLLIFRNSSESVSLLKEFTKNTNQILGKIHAIHSLNGLDALSFSFLQEVILNSKDSGLISHCLILLEQFASENKIQKMSNLLDLLLIKNNPEIDLYITLSLNEWASLSKETIFSTMLLLSNRHEKNIIYQEGIMASLKGLELNFINYTEKNDKTFSSVLDAILTKTLMQIEKGQKNSIYTNTSTQTDGRTAGHYMYKSICAACHGMNGNGISGVAPPLMNSEYVSESAERLALIILHGMKGPVHVKGQLYNLNGTMPGLANNPEISDQDILSIISYLHNAFAIKAKNTSIERVKELRNKLPKDGSLYTEVELNSLK